uniref:Uncharacterized protein n=1 Tax=Cajanus cajan TaxID=3821 RepID=A0A151R0A1_CAJCA|nr:hypothetical protein KK1_042962 [Cajanus cajan]
MHGITSSSISLLWNGSKINQFFPQRGLRQGDPLSPYLFVIYMECLGRMITTEVQKGCWMPIHISNGGPTILHLFFLLMMCYYLGMPNLHRQELW